MTMKSKSNYNLIILSLGVTLFLLHFGASSMIWPMTWGKESGTSIIPAFIGVYLTAVFMPLLGYLALANGKGSFYKLSKRISPRFARVFCNITMLALGPLFVIPRMSAAAWDAFLQTTNINSTSMIPLLVFTVIYYLVVFWFISSKENTMDKISKFLVPLLLITVSSVLIKGVVTPISTQGLKMYSQPSFVYGFLEGYATMELPCALLFGGIIIHSLKSKISDEKKLNRSLILVGLVGTTILAISHFLHMYIGSNTSGFFDSLRYSSLYAQVVVELWGTVGGVIFNVGLIFAALTTAIGLTASTSEFYEEVSNGRVKYRNAAIIITILSGIVSILGLENIVVLIEPFLTMIYPPTIVMTLLYAIVPNMINDKRKLSSMRIGVYVATAFGIIDGFIGYTNLFNFDISYLEKIYNTLPLSSYGLSWIVFSAVGCFIGYFYKRNERTLEPNSN